VGGRLSLAHSAQGFIERIIFLDAIPAVTYGLKPQLGAKVEEQMQINLKDELDAIHNYNHAVEVCTKAGDDGSRALFERTLKDEERHADFLESQLHAIEEMGIGPYLAQYLHEKE